MTEMRRFTLQVVMIFSIASLIAAYPLLRYGSDAVLVAAVTGAVLSTANVLVGFLTIQMTFHRSYTTFLKWVLGGMGVRMAVTLGALLLLILVFRLHAVALTVAVVSFSLMYLVLEILVLHRMVQTKNQG